MTRLAILADIHGNMPALEAVIADIREQEVDEVLVGGDLVGRGPEGSRVIARIRSLDWPSVRGNHEDYLVHFKRGEVPDDWHEAEEWSALRWMAADLTDDDVAYIESLPFTLLSRELPQLRLVHASPHSNNDGIGPWTSERRLQKHFDSVEESILVCGHTHRPLEHRFSDGVIVNVGSVGLPFNADRRAQYAIFTGRRDRTEVEFRQVEYPLEEIFAIYEGSGFQEQGGATALLLRLELEHAQPFLVPFLHWSSTLGIQPTEDQIDRFREVYDPSEPMRSFFERIDQMLERDPVSRGARG